MSVVVVTGAAGGMGRAQVADLAAAGYTVHALDRELPTGLPGGVTGRALDVTDADAWAAFAAELADRHGSVHGLVNHAGVIDRHRLDEVDPATVHRLVDVNLVGPLLGIRFLSPLMGAGASIVTIGSVAALTAYYPVAYTASKWALRGLTKVAAAELGARGIRVNAVHPGFVETPMTAGASDRFRAASTEFSLLGRAGRPQDVVPVVSFLLGDGARHVTGAEIPVDGGAAAHGGAKPLNTAANGVAP
ncbi:SDR family oxidoreductase [Pseudonocardia sp. C8]|uniref:SDR family NAD(P)-dependent oxidoreductase n=1 Tax=Pseudonocardia sp. C8 TaxID=2762759 RepID=UPI001643063A|nr:SDR family oxidoreductase [Pseudonocardia sp. C8]MBC3191111.1 SDR family oxidoreductase [Pseudonocardia sp. C8]